MTYKRIYNYAIRQMKKHRQFIIYVLIGGIAAIIDFTTVFVLTSLLGIFYIVSVMLSYPLATFVHFIMNKKFNFRCTSRKVMRQFCIFIVINLVAMGLTIVIMYAMVEYLGMWYLLAKFIAMWIVVFYSFNMNRMFTFKVAA